MAKKSERLLIDSQMGPQKYFKLTENYDPAAATYKYLVEIEGPDGFPFDPIKVDSILDNKTVVQFVAQELVKNPNLAYGANGVPYLWVGNHWKDANGWAEKLSDSMHSLIRTGELRSNGAACFYNSLKWKWSASQNRDLPLKAFGVCKGIPLRDGVMSISEDGIPSVTPHEPEQLNLHFLPTTCQEVSDAFVELEAGMQDNSMLMRFLRSSLTADQIVTVRRWFGMHLVFNRIQNPEKLMYFYGSGGNGKSVIVNLLQGLLTPDAIAAVTLDDLRTPANVERLVGKMAMIGTEGAAKTDCSVNEILKRIVSRENINVNPKYRDPFNLMPECLVTQASNKAPQFDDDSEAMVRRVIALQLEYTPTEHEKILGIAERVRSGDEYPLLVAFALQGAMEIMAAGTIEIPDSVKDASEAAVRPVRTVDRFIDTLETGNYEVADEELYVSYSLMCKKQGLKLMPRKEFLRDLEVRLGRRGYIFQHRLKAKHYVPQAQINERGIRLLLAPQLREAPNVDIFLGIRIRDVEHGLPVGGPIHHSRRDTVDYGNLAVLAE